MARKKDKVKAPKKAKQPRKVKAPKKDKLAMRVKNIQRQIDHLDSKIQEVKALIADPNTPCRGVIRRPLP